MKMLMKGLMILKKQYGRYSIVGTFSTKDWVVPHVFHGTSTEVTVAESSVERLSRRPSNPFSLYRFL